MQARQWVEEIEGKKVIIDRREGETAIIVGDQDLVGIVFKEEMTKQEADDRALAFVLHLREETAETPKPANIPESLHQMWKWWVTKMFQYGQWGKGNWYMFPGNRVRQWRSSTEIPYEQLSDDEKRVYENLARELFG